MSNANAFMASAKKSKHEQSVIQNAQAEELVSINVRIPASLRTKGRLHHVETGESLTALVRRLLEAELD